MKKFNFEIVPTNPFDYLTSIEIGGGTCNCSCSVSAEYSAGYSVGNFDANHEN
jgi:hypothetical protein